MASGQPPVQGPQGPYPTYQPVYQQPHRQPIEYIRPLVSDVILAIGVIIGLFLVMLASILAGVSDTGSGWDISMALRAFGVFLLTATMFLGGLIRVDMEKWVRVALIFGAVLLISWVGFWLY